MTPLPAAAALDAYFLEARSKLLDVAAILDRIGRGPGTDRVLPDPRMQKIRQAIEILLRDNGGRAEAVQALFSLGYDPAWKRPEPR